MHAHTWTHAHPHTCACTHTRTHVHAQKLTLVTVDWNNLRSQGREGVENLLAVTSRFQSSFKCNGWVNVSNFTILLIYLCSSAKTVRFTQHWVRSSVCNHFPTPLHTAIRIDSCNVTHHLGSSTLTWGISVMVFVVMSSELQLKVIPTWNLLRQRQFAFALLFWLQTKRCQSDTFSHLIGDQHFGWSDPWSHSH